MTCDCPSGDCSTPDLKSRVAAVLEEIRPLMQRDGGDLKLIDVSDDGVVQVRFLGACMGCMAASMTLTQGIEGPLKARVPEVTRVVLA